MNIYDYSEFEDRFYLTDKWNHRYRVLPDNCTIIFNSNLIKNSKLYPVRPACEVHEYIHWLLEFQKVIMKSDLSQANQHIFLDFSYDPCVFSENQIKQILEWLQNCFKQSTIWWLSGDCRYFTNGDPQILYYPYWLLNNSVETRSIVKKHRFGCLNRNPAKHRHQLMYELLSQGLFDSRLDRYSWNFNWPGTQGILSFGLTEVESFMNLELRLNEKNYISNCYDNSPNDHSLDHPAWSAYLQLITETSPYDNGIITEKTIKGILSQSLFTVINSQYSKQLFSNFGFDIEYFNQSPVEVAKEYQNLEKLQEKYHEELHRITFNLEWFLSNSWKNIYLRYLTEHIR